jgi:predicted adenylyl cyclase CyaB
VHNIEIKAKCPNPQQLHDKLMALGAKHIGRDHQVDTYFRVGRGRLKLREGTIENALISYDRPDRADAKRSDFTLYRSGDTATLKSILEERLGKLVVVDKQRDIYFIGEVKFHIDSVMGLEPHMEIEVTNMDGSRSLETMQSTCAHYMEILGIRQEDLVSNSYSDLLLKRQ